MRKYTITLAFLFILLSAAAQDADTSKTLDEVIVRSFEQNRSSTKTTLSVKVLVTNNADRYNKISLVNSFNTIAGVRMEERSPGSYRINIRGSSLRSPFGVRNIKVYWNDIPFTDPGGNTYFNQFAWNNFSFIEIFKGPAGSMYGAGTGGLINMTTTAAQPGATVEYVTGSYGLQNIFTSFRYGKKENKNEITYAHNETNGYRVQTNMRRDNVSWTSQIKISNKQELHAAFLFNDLTYQTPGALTLAEYKANPKAARPAAGVFPSAVGAKATIYQKNITTGITSIYHFSEHIKNQTTVYGSFSQVKNPTIRNYERRNEPSYGARSFFMFNNTSKETPVQVITGIEYQQGFFNTLVSKNKNGNPDTIQTNDDINYNGVNVFAQGDVSFKNNFFISGGVSLNKTQVSFQRLNVYPVLLQKRSYRNELAPRLSIRKNFTEHTAARGTVSRGFSPPTVAELLPSNGTISTDLEAEYGWNYELSFLYNNNWRNHYLNIEATGVYFKLNNALVQRRDNAGADYFINAGDVQQKSLELHVDYSYSSLKKDFVDYAMLRADYSYNHFRYGSFVKGSDNFSGKTVPSVPTNAFSLLADVQSKHGLYLNITYYSASKIFLNDANTAVADPYHLLGTRIGWKKLFHKTQKLNVYAGVDNLLNEVYSLGNDINAAGGRYYNAAPARNFYVGIAWQWMKK